MSDSILFEVSGAGVGSITLNRPEVLNSFNREMSAAFVNVLERAAEDRKVRAILITGNGRAFCTGQDLAEFTEDIKQGVTPILGPIVRERYNPIVKLIRQTEKPFVCAVNGVAAGAGANLALCCDIVLAAQTASFIQSFSKVGLIPDSAGSFILPRLVGFGRAQALALLAEKVSAEDAVGMGMIYKAYPPEELLPRAQELATQLACQPTRGLGFTKRLFNASSGNDLESQLELEEKMQDAAGRTYDYSEGVLAFLEKRAPNFKGE
jgi:2-(1,2-epoxy-1,2-dihydrophenyl)acetyl-CoA isomerase